MTEILVTVFQIAAAGFVAYGAILTGTQPRVFNARRERQVQMQVLSKIV